MESILRKAILPILFLCVFIAMLPVPKVKAAYSFNFYGAYYDDGTFAGAVNCTLWRENQSPVNFELNGTYSTSADVLPAILQIHLAYNESRTMYLLEAGDYYVFIPQEGNLYTYYFQILDFMGVTDGGYIETWLNVNGTLRLIERQWLGLMNDIPFIMSWSFTYWVAIYHEDYGRAYAGTYIAKSKTTFLIGITPDLFPQAIPSTSGIYRSCIRVNGTYVSFYYSDTQDQTDWVYFAVYQYGSETPIASLNTSEPASWYYNDLNPEETYLGRIEISHSLLGSKVWSYILPSVEAEDFDNPFAILDDFGDFAFPLRYLPPVLMIIAIFLVFTWWNLPVGIVVGYLFAALFVYLGWIPVTWEWLMVSGTISFIIAIGMAKERESVVF